MKPRLHQHTWHPLPGTVGLLTVCEIEEPWAQTRAQLRQGYWIFDYEFQPAGRFRVGDARAPWQPRPARTMHLYAPRVTYWEDTRHQPGRRHSAWMFFTGGEHLGLGRFLHPRLRYARFEDPTGAFGELFQALARLGHQAAEAGFWQAQSLFWQLLDRVQQTRRVDQETWRLVAADAAAAPRFTDEVAGWLRAHIAERVTIGGLASQFRVSRSLLFQRFRREIGDTPLGLLARLRVAEAKRLILQDVPLKEVAARLGFCDQFHLSKACKRLEGLGPRALLRMRK